MRPKVMWHLLRRYMASRLHSLRMGGYLFSGSQAPQLSPALMRALGQKCPNLQRLCLHVANLSMVPIASLPCTLRTLELHSCEISMAWLHKEQDPTVLPLLERIVLETDAPYLAPVPMRGQRNESTFIPYIAQKVAELKGISVEEVAEVTSRNAEALFGI